MLRRAMVGLLAVITACGLTVVGVSDGPTDAGALDATAAVTPPAKAADGAVPPADASTTTPSPIPDAAVADARAPDAAAPVTFCTGSTATFCSDFDRASDTTATAAGWTPLPLAGSATLGLVDVAHSSPRALRAVAAGGNAAAVQKTVTVASSLRVDYWVRYNGLPTGSPLVASVMITPPNPPGEDFFFFASRDRSYFQQFGDFYSQMLGAMSEDTWHHVVISITTNDSRVSATVDGTTYWNNATFPHAWPRPTNAIIEVGAARLYQATSAEVWIDDVVITAN